MTSASSGRMKKIDCFFGIIDRFFLKYAKKREAASNDFENHFETAPFCFTAVPLSAVSESWQNG